MNENDLNQFWNLLAQRYRSHPWHGIEIGEEAPEVINSFIEVVQTDTVKYEIDKASGYLKVDRPQKFSNIVPAPYGFIPKTYCDRHVADYTETKTGRTEIVGDGDPLDVLILTERNITHGDVLVPALPIGGLRMIDGGEADDKIVAVLKGDEVYKEMQDISDCPENLIERLRHYFLTYKDMPGQGHRSCEVTHIYSREEAYEVIRRSQQDYMEHYGDIDQQLLDAANQALKKSDQ
jgi:inorganic pyrophosphatase